MADWNSDNISRFYPNWGGMSSDLQTLAKQYALANQNINGGQLPSFDSFVPQAQANYSGALPTGLNVVRGPNGGFAVGSGNMHPLGYEIPTDPRGAEDFSIARAVAYQNDPSRYDSRWGGSTWTGDDMWLTSPGGATFARSDLLNPNLTDADIIARNKQYASGAITPMAAVKGATGEGAPLYYFNDPESLKQKAAEDEAAVRQAAAIRGAVPGEVSANAAVIGQAAQNEAIERIKASLPDVSGLRPNQNLDGSINYDWMVNWATGKATKPAWADQYEQSWNAAAQDFIKEAQQPSQQQQLSQVLAPPAPSPISSPPGSPMATALRSMAPQADQYSSDPFVSARQDWATWGAGQGDYAKPSWWGGVKGGEFKPLELTEQPAPGSPEAMSQEAPFNPVYQPSTATTAPLFSTSASMGLANSNGMYQPTYGANPDVQPVASGNTAWGDIGGVIGSALPIPGGSLIGRGLGIALEISNANTTLADMGVQGHDLGVSDWGRAMVPSWMGGTDVNTATNAAITSQAPYANSLYSFGGPYSMDLQASSLGGGNFGFGAGGMF